MATLNLGLEFHVGSPGTLRIHFHRSGTFCSPDAGNFTPPLPHGVFFQQGQRWPETGEATPTVQNAVTRYTFHQSQNPVPCEQLMGVDSGGVPVSDSGGVPVSTDHVIHIP
jgi:hypothetical protein